MRYPGGKGGAGVHQKIINLIPEHETYIEPFLGAGNIVRKKKPARETFVLDLNGEQLDRMRPYLPAGSVAINGDAARWLAAREWTGREFVYCDPPYVHATRTCMLYQHEMTDDQHVHLLSLLLTVPAAVMVSGYRSELYADMLAGWRTIDFQAMTRGGMKTETLWLNYEPPAVPADLAFLGANYRERERIKRKKARWAAKLAKLPAAERAAIMEILQGLDKGAGQ